MGRGPGRAGGPGGGRRSAAAASWAQERSHVGCGGGGTGGGGDGGGEGGGGGGDGGRGAPRGRAPAGHALLPLRPPFPPGPLKTLSLTLRPPRRPSDQIPTPRGQLPEPHSPGPRRLSPGPCAPVWLKRPRGRRPLRHGPGPTAAGPVLRPPPSLRSSLRASGRPAPRGWAKGGGPASPADRGVGRRGRRAPSLSQPSRPRRSRG